MDGEVVSPWMIGALTVAISTLAGVVAFLFKRSDKRDAIAKRERDAEREQNQKDRDAWVTDRAGWLLERSRIEAEYESKLRQHAERYIEDARLDRDANRDHEDIIRREFTELMESLAAKNDETSRALVTMLHKFYDRFVGPTRRY